MVEAARKNASGSYSNSAVNQGIVTEITRVEGKFSLTKEKFKVVEAKDSYADTEFSSDNIMVSWSENLIQVIFC